MTGNRPRLVSIIGSRPEIIQAAPLSAALRDHADEILVHTGQHYDPEMSGLQIADLRLPRPDYDLAVGSLPDLEQLELGEARIGAVLDREHPKPDAVLVRGDTNATLAGARAAAARGLPLLHVEAGLRSFRSDMPEERNRIATDRIADVMFAPTVGAVRNLADLDVAGTVHLTGDVLCDVLHATRDKLPSGEARGEYLLATVHRNYNTDDPERLKAVLSCLESAPCPVVMPLHPRTRLRIEEAGLRIPANVEPCGPVTYSQMLVLERDAAAIATDSGGVQREAYLWGVPCLTLREETEWVETVQTGWNTIVGADPAAFRAALGCPRPTERPPVFGDGRAAERIAALISEHIADRHIMEEANVA